MINILVLGSGTSTGVPVILCDCKVCKSSNPKNKRFRASVYLEVDNHDGSKKYFLIDSGQDFRTQALTHSLPRIDAVFYTHAHADHIFGLDDLRVFNFKQKCEIPIYADSPTSEALLRVFSYCFDPDPDYEGGGLPKLSLKTIEKNNLLNIFDQSVSAIPIFHGKQAILGFRIGNFAYLTDCSKVPESSIEMLKGINTLIVSGLRHKEHKTHFTITQAKEFALSLNIPQTYLTHIAHDIDHDETDDELNQETLGRVRLCFDGLKISVPNLANEEIAR